MSTLEKTWQCIMNQAMSTADVTTNNKNSIWWLKAFICGQVSSTAVLAGQWRVYSSCDGAGGSTFGNGDYKDYWGTVGSIVQGPTAGASTTAGASANRIRITGLSGMTSASVGRYLELSGAANAANNSPGVVGGVSTQPFKIVNYVNATTVDIYNPTGVAGDSSITWTERNAHTFTVGKIVNASAANHSWVVLESWSVLPDGPVYITLDCNNASTYITTILWSKTAPTAGTAIARPTATDEVTATNWLALNVSANGNAQHLSGALTSDGNFVIASASRSSGFLTHLIIFQRLADTKSGDACPFEMIAINGTSGTPTTTELLAVGNNGTRNFTNSSTIRCPPLPFAFGSNSVILTTAYASGGMPVQDSTDGLYAALPMYCCNITASQYTIKGRLYDICWAPGSLSDNAAEPSVASATRIKMGHLWLPFNAQFLLA